MTWPASQEPRSKKPGRLEVRRSGVEACGPTSEKWAQREKIFVLYINANQKLLTMEEAPVHSAY